MLDVPADHEWTPETERLQLAPMTESDAAELHELRQPLDSDAPVADGSPPSNEPGWARGIPWHRGPVASDPDRCRHAALRVL